MPQLQFIGGKYSRLEQTPFKILNITDQSAFDLVDSVAQDDH